MPKSSEIAAALRFLADHLDRYPDLEQKRPWVNFYCGTKEEFLAGAQILPRPIKKSENGDHSESWSRIILTHEIPAIDLQVSVLKSLTCELVEPAKPAVYRCDPILSAIEEAQLGSE